MSLDEARVLIERFLNDHGLELVDLQARNESGHTAVRLLVDKPQGGISMDECARINRALGAMLDEAGAFCAAGTGNFALEVFSPGLDRPLSTLADFRRNRGNKAKFFLKQQFDGKIEWDGLISTVSEGHVDVETDKGMLQIPLPLIHKAKLLFNGN